MSVYEDYDGLERPNRRPVSSPPKPRQNRTAWLILILLYMGGCSYWGWQVFLRPEPEQAQEQTSTFVEDSDALVADDFAAQGAGESAFVAASDTGPASPILPPSAPIAPSSKPASVKTQRPKRNGRPLDKMEAETGLVYDTDWASPASVPGLEHADYDALSPQSEGVDPDGGVDINYAGDPTIDQRDIPPASESARGVVLDQTEEKRRSEPELEPEPAPLPPPEPGLDPLPPVIEVETAPDLPPPVEEDDILVLSETPPPVEEIILAPPPPEPASPQINVVIDPHPPIAPPFRFRDPSNPSFMSSQPQR